MADVNVTSDSEYSDDFNDENWFGSTTASADNSSINSIPWAEDVVNQNKIEWDCLERMFYGESELPKDEKLRSEIIEWTDKFPHLRIVGKQAPIFFNVNATQSESSHEEVLAIHPPRAISHCSSSSACSAASSRAESVASLELDMQKCLRITSGPLLLRRSEHAPSRLLTRKTHPQLHDAGVPDSARSSYGTRIFSKVQNEIGVKDIFPQSARLINVSTAQLSSPIGKLFRISTASVIPRNKPLRNSVTLPAISLRPIAKESSHDRSVSALIGTTPGIRIPSVGSCKSRSESE